MFYAILAYHVERAAKTHPRHLETTYRDARNYVAYCMK